MGLAAITPHPTRRRVATAHEVYPYLLRSLLASRPNDACGADITYIRLLRGFVCLVAVLNLFSRYVLAWAISSSLDFHFCVWALDWALEHEQPDIFNTDQGPQLTAPAFTGRLAERGILISVIGKGAWIDNGFVERLWGTVKCEKVYLHDDVSLAEAVRRLNDYFVFYNTERPHQSLGDRTPKAVHLHRTAAQAPLRSPSRRFARCAAR